MKRKYTELSEDQSKCAKVCEENLHEHLRDNVDVNSENNSLLPLGSKTKPNSLGCVEDNSSDSDSDIDLFADSPSFDDSDDNTPIETESNDWDDKEGRLRYRIGEILDQRYKVIGYYGKGTFGNVLRVQDIHKENEFYAVKVARSHHEMFVYFCILCDRSNIVLQELCV